MSYSKDLSGLVFGRLTVSHKTGVSADGNSIMWLCNCECGNTINTRRNNLVRGSTKSCGCLVKETRKQKGKNIKDLTGKRFGELTVYCLANKRGNDRSAYWHCECDCGNYSTVSTNNLNSGEVQRCKDCGNKRGNKTHGLTNTRTYKLYQNMKTRCYNPNRDSWQRYGGRGITVCERWLESYENFLADMGECPEGLTLDRINNDGNYEPSNCRWTNWSEQAKNRTIWQNERKKELST